ncbi:MAG: SDR family oxidoreductase [Rhodobacteraceae bacterium]|nr:SDR family oxidoreductase [Paracoccaceae bacterium]
MLKKLLLALVAIPVLVILAIMIAFLQGNGQGVAHFPLNPRPAAVTAEDDAGVLIFGASRNTGFDVAEILAARGTKVTAFVRAQSNTGDLEKLGVPLAYGDALDMPSVERAFAEKQYSAVVTTIGCIGCNPKPDYLGNKNIFDAAKAAGVRRVILITTIGAGDSYDAAPLPARQFLKEMLPLKTQAEDHLKSLGLDYTIIRPGGLKTAAPTGRAFLSEDRETSGLITRADLAGLIVAALDDPNTIGKTLAAIDEDFRFPFDLF